jgi:hypothetical protein
MHTTRDRDDFVMLVGIFYRALRGAGRPGGPVGMRIEAGRRNTVKQIEALSVETQQAQVPVGGIKRHG